MATAEVTRKICYSPSNPGGPRRKISAEEIAAVEKITKIGHEKEGHTAIRLKGGGVRYTRDEPDDILKAAREALKAAPAASELVDVSEAAERGYETLTKPDALQRFEKELREEIRNDPYVHAAWAAIRQGADYHGTVLALLKGFARRET